MRIKGHEISRFWFFFCSLCYFSLCVSYWEKWDSAITWGEHWYFIPELIFGLIIGGRILAAIITSHKKLPGCTCMKATFMYRIGSGVFYPDGPQSLWVRFPVALGRLCGMYSFACFLSATIFYLGKLGIVKARYDNLIILGLLSMLLFGLQVTHYVCLIYFNQLVLEALHIRLTYLEESLPEGLEDVVVQRGPADVSAYLTLMTENMYLIHAECPICADYLEVNTEVVKLPCAHVFHTQCAAAWLGSNPTCPICRTAVSLPLPPSVRETRQQQSSMTSEEPYPRTPPV